MIRCHCGKRSCQVCCRCFCIVQHVVRVYSTYYQLFKSRQYAGPRAFCRKTAILSPVQQLSVFKKAGYQVFLKASTAGPLHKSQKSADLLGRFRLKYASEVSAVGLWNKVSAYSICVSDPEAKSSVFWGTMWSIRTPLRWHWLPSGYSIPAPPVWKTKSPGRESCTALPSAPAVVLPTTVTCGEHCICIARYSDALWVLLSTRSTILLSGLKLCPRPIKSDILRVNEPGFRKSGVTASAIGLVEGMRIVAQVYYQPAVLQAFSEIMRRYVFGMDVCD